MINSTNTSSAADSTEGELPRGNFSSFDLGKFRVPQDLSDAHAQPIITTVRVGKPPKGAFFRVHPEPEFRLEVGVIEQGIGGSETYLIAGELYEELVSEPTFSSRILVTAVTRNGTPFMWPLRANADNSWTRSAHDAVQVAVEKWIRLRSNHEAGAYEVMAAINQTAAPTWPAMNFAKLVELAFRGRIIDSPDHPVLRALRGE
ncbi:MAG: hypothetical protein QOD99_2359 [Chthoniobacter sp.]|jgi:hypothetical protein|nr:hypothetical protein [Chthoniobacter sp.]